MCGVDSGQPGFCNFISLGSKPSNITVHPNEAGPGIRLLAALGRCRVCYKRGITKTHAEATDWPPAIQL